jgi:hypothetical protein
MKWRVLLELKEANGNVETRELVTGHQPRIGMSLAAIGLTLAEGKFVLAAMQTELVHSRPMDIVSIGAPVRIAALPPSRPEICPGYQISKGLKPATRTLWYLFPWRNLHRCANADSV